MPELGRNAVVSVDQTLEVAKLFHTRILSARPSAGCRILEKPIDGQLCDMCSLRVMVQGTNRRTLHIQFVRQADGRVTVLAHYEPDTLHAPIKHIGGLLTGTGVDEKEGANRVRKLWKQLMPEHQLHPLGNALCPGCRDVYRGFNLS